MYLQHCDRNSGCNSLQELRKNKVSTVLDKHDENGLRESKTK